MSVSRNPWGSPAAAAAHSHSSVNFLNVVDEELAAKLQREEEEQFELEIAGRFGDDRQVGWCFVEVPSTVDREFGVMTVVQQEVRMDEHAADDPDYTFALELQAQEAEEYDRLRRQEEASMERIRVMQQEHPRREEIRQTLLQKFYVSGGHAGSVGDEYDDGDDDERYAAGGSGGGGNDGDMQRGRWSGPSTPFATAAAPATKVAAAHSCSSSCSRVDEDFELVGEVDDGRTEEIDGVGSEPQHLRPHAAQQPVAAGSVDRVHLRDLDIHRGIYIDGDDLALPRKKLNSLSQTLKHADRKRSFHSHHRRPKTHGDQTTETT
ncbi:hypothetical protein PybrP1_001003 [[Pythium] brassicae (nom. inval.)]|nr:hypothetical protein PybrP1_001003 [[Pythium] brassicae (nom. inval.)]